MVHVRAVLNAYISSTKYHRDIHRTKVTTAGSLRSLASTRRGPDSSSRVLSDQADKKIALFTSLIVQCTRSRTASTRDTTYM